MWRRRFTVARHPTSFLCAVLSLSLCGVVCFKCWKIFYEFECVGFLFDIFLEETFPRLIWNGSRKKKNRIHIFHSLNSEESERRKNCLCVKSKQNLFLQVFFPSHSHVTSTKDFHCKESEIYGLFEWVLWPKESVWNGLWRRTPRMTQDRLW